MLNFQNLQLRRGTRVLLENATFTLYRGEKVGIIGANGSGKSSLLALVRGELHAESGDFSRPADLRVAWVAQEVAALTAQQSTTSSMATLSFVKQKRPSDARRLLTTVR